MAFRPDREVTLQVEAPPTTATRSEGITWTTLGTPWAEKTDARESRRGEYQAAGRFTDVAFTLFKIRWNTAYLPVQQVLCEGITYKVIGVPCEIGRHQYLEILGEKTQ